VHGVGTAYALAVNVRTGGSHSGLTAHLTDRRRKETSYDR